MSNFVFSLGKQQYRETINFVSYIHVVIVYTYSGISYNYYFMGTSLFYGYKYILYREFIEINKQKNIVQIYTSICTRADGRIGSPC